MILRHRSLFALNQRGLTLDAATARAEDAWAQGLVSDAVSDSRVAGLPDYFGRLHNRLEFERTTPAAGLARLAATGTRDDLVRYLRNVAVDGLTEAREIPLVAMRLPLDVMMPVMRIVIDEFGCGALASTHTEIFKELLREVGLPVELDAYVDSAPEALLEILNFYSWMARRAPTTDYYLGALAYAEAAVPIAFVHFTEACARLGVARSAYFTEHVHIDGYHSRDANEALRLAARRPEFSAARAWAGAAVVARLGDAADFFEDVP